MNFSIIEKELQFKAIRSSGPGGQHVNKVASKIELVFDIANSSGLTEKEKALAFQKLANRISKDNLLILTCQERRSQHQNKVLVITQLFRLLKQCFIISKTRKATKPTRSSVIKKAKNKKRQSEKKQSRRKPTID
ncbi:alternative ribosome rescue aminoacyl-tRNA hydrolase ArfB [Tenacibaculum amylolyticum]|uniref:alternative ribosome rescue aminoacyl-tRNA hydrolase ArfB n=1 Tax=Tenacibaculum amylolyticum TaxID=104269 RepID=UPI003893A3C8